MQHVISPVTHSHPDAVRSTGLCVPLVAEASKPDPKAKEGNYNVKTRSDDLLLYWAELMKVPELASGVRQHFDHGLVAENQDNDPFQAAILLGLKSDGAGVPASAVEIDMRQCRSRAAP